MDGAPSGLFSSQLFGTGSRTRAAPQSDKQSGLKILAQQQRIVDVKFRMHLHFVLCANNNYTQEFVVRAPRSVECERPWALCITTMDVGQYSCDAPGAEVYLQLDAPLSRLCHLDAYPDVEVDYPLPQGPFNNLMGVMVYVGTDPTQPSFTNVQQQLLGRWGGYSQATDAMKELVFDDDGKLTNGPPTSPILYYARETNIPLMSATRDNVATFCKTFQEKNLGPVRKLVYTCGETAGRLMLLPTPKSDGTTVSGSIMFQCRARRIDMVRPETR